MNPAKAQILREKVRASSSAPTAHDPTTTPEGQRALLKGLQWSVDGIIGDALKTDQQVERDVGRLEGKVNALMFGLLIGVATNLWLFCIALACYLRVLIHGSMW